MKLFLSPHTDDETLFGAFTIQREHPLVVVVFDSYIQPARGAAWCDWQTRRAETSEAMNELLFAPEVRFCGLRDDKAYTIGDIEEAIRTYGWFGFPGTFDGIIAPYHETNGHDQHNLVALAAKRIAKHLEIPLISYTTYTRTGGKRRTEHPVPIEHPFWIERKLRALACYRSQIRLENCRDHFTRDLIEYTVE